MATFLANVATALASFLTGESPLPANAEPPTPDNVLTLYSTGGPMGALDFSGNVQEDRTVQLRFRDATQSGVQTRCEAAYEAVKAWRTYSGAGWSVRLKASTSPLYSYPRDADNRSIASFNIVVQHGH